MKKILTILLSALLVTSLAACSTDAPKEGGQTTDGEKKYVVGFVTDTGGLGDQGYNDAVYSGLTKASEELGFEVKMVESKEIGDYANNLRAVFNDGADVAICAGASFADAVIQVAAEYPDKTILAFDAEVDGVENVVSSMFKEEEAAFVLGAFAGLVTKTGTVGYIAGVESPLQERAKNGFEAGFMTTNPTGKVIGIYAGTYNDVGKGKEIANTLFTQGADYVASFAGACNLGVFQAATDAGEGKYALGAALGQFDKNPEKIIASQVKTVDLTVYNALNEFIGGTSSAGITTRGIKEGGVDILFNPNADLVKTVASDEILQQVDAIRTQVMNGEIQIPLTKEDLASFGK
ncbi:BMP family lipoprotein [Anaerorhabdus sp.]|uniref:BMP family lipoprotein n=1 Tax=Anaerorhabdus sp. TaxID=1872524 RepID=UPI002FC8BF2C